MAIANRYSADINEWINYGINEYISHNDFKHLFRVVSLSLYIYILLYYIDFVSIYEVYILFFIWDEVNKWEIWSDTFYDNTVMRRTSLTQSKLVTQNILLLSTVLQINTSTNERNKSDYTPQKLIQTIHDPWGGWRKKYSYIRTDRNIFNLHCSSILLWLLIVVC